MTPEPELDRTLSCFDRVLFADEPAASDLEALAAPGGASRDRFLLYRELVRSRLRDLAATALPRTTGLLGRAHMNALVEARLSAAPPTTRFFREVVPELFPEHAPALASEAHPHADDLARLELAQWCAMWEEVDQPAVAEFDFARAPVVHPGMRRLTLTASVHWPDRPIELGRFHIAVYRRRDHVVETRWMSEALAAILDQWRTGELSAIEGVRVGLASAGKEPTPALVEDMSGMLAELLERGGILGSRATA